MSMKMTKDERETFLAGLHVGVISLGRPDKAPLTVPIWYDYTPGGDVWFITGADSPKGRLLQPGAPVAVCTQTEDPPYKYCTVQGRVVAVGPADLEKDLRPMARRYLGDELGDQYVASTGAEGQIRVSVTPESWLTVDYAKM